MSHFCLTGEDHWLCRRGWQHSPMGARVQRQTLRQPGQTRVYWWSEICLIFFKTECTGAFIIIRMCVMFQVPAIRRCWFPTVREPWMISHTAGPSHESCPTSFLSKVRLSLCISNMSCEIGLVDVCVIAEPVCAVGQGVAALCCATEEHKWIFSGYSMTGVSDNVM